MQQVRDIHVRGSKRRLLVSHDTTVVSFRTVDGLALPSLNEVVYWRQRESLMPHSTPCVGDECLVLEKEDNGDAMVVARYCNNDRQSTHRISDLTSNSDFKKIIQTGIAKISEEKGFGPRKNPFTKVEVVATDGEWKIQYTAFTGGCFDEAVSVEYAFDMESFVRLCDKYRLPFFGSLSGGGYSILEVGDLVHNSQTVYSGNYDGMSCLVERVPMDTIGSPDMGRVHYLWKKQKILNDHNNILRICNSKCDGRECQFATEIWHTSLYDKIMLNNIDRLERDEFIRLMREVAIGISYSHSQDIAHCAICPQNIVLTFHDNLLAVPKIRGWSSCTDIDGQSDLVYQDVYCIGLMLFRGLVEPKTSFSIDSYSNAWRSRQKFKDDVKRFKEKNPLAADLVERCLDPSRHGLTALSIADHYVFWPKGRHIYFINRIDALRDGKNAIILHHLQLPHDVYVGNWIEKFPENWRKTRCKGYGTSLLELVRFVRNIAEHLLDINNKATRKVWATLLVFEVWILENFPNLFRLLYNAGFAAHAADAWVLAEFFK